MWHNPLPLGIIPTSDSDSFLSMPDGFTGLPVGQHVGAFGVKRKFHTHEGIDLYASAGTPVRAVEAGVVVAVINFTGMLANPPSPWWWDTEAVLVEGETGVVVYGEISKLSTIHQGYRLEAGELLGYVEPVLKVDKGRPMSMLHLELHQHGTRDAYEWLDERPISLLDPTPHLLLPLFHLGRDSTPPFL